MTFLELDQRIRQAIPDGVERRRILQGLHDIEEGQNQVLGFLLQITNHQWTAGGWVKQDHTRFQVQ